MEDAEVHAERQRYNQKCSAMKHEHEPLITVNLVLGKNQGIYTRRRSILPDGISVFVREQQGTEHI